jgi:hypothetical protein
MNIIIDIEKKKLTDNENEVDGEIPNEEEDMDEDEVRKKNQKLIFCLLKNLFRQPITSIHILIQVIKMTMISMMMEVMVEIKFSSFLFLFV